MQGEDFMDAWKKLTEQQETFLLRVHRSEQGVWNGNVVWIGGKSEQSFANMQELISLIDCAISGDEEE